MCPSRQNGQRVPVTAVYEDGFLTLNRDPGRPLLVAIAEWDRTRDYRQMDERLKAVGSRLTLRAEGYPDVPFELNGGNMSSGNGTQVYIARLVDRSAMVSGVTYKVVDTTGHWIVPDGVFVVRPKR